MKKKDKVYCILCGNALDPKIHITDFGKTSEEVAEKQKEWLKAMIKYSAYQTMPDIPKEFCVSIIDELLKNQ